MPVRTRARKLLLAGTAAGALLAVAGAVAAEVPGGCELRSRPGGTGARCTACHGAADPATDHVVNVDHEAARTRRAWEGRSPLRPADEVIARGVFLDEGRVTCLTCHDAASPWHGRVAVPGPAEPLDVESPLTARRGRAREVADARALCAACHVVGG